MAFLQQAFNLNQRQVRLFGDQRQKPLGLWIQWPRTLLASVAPERRHCCTHLIAEAGLTAKTREASRADIPLSTAPSTRARKSFE